MKVPCPAFLSRARCWATVCALAWGLATPAIQARDLRIVTIDSAPFGFVGADGRPAGIMHDISNLIAREAGFGFTNHVLPYPRTALAVVAGEADFVIRYRSAELEAGAVQVGGVLSLPTIVIGKPSLHLKGLADLHGKIVATPRGGRFDEAFEGDAAITKYPVADYPTALRMLASGRVDAVMGSSVGVLYNAHLAGVKRSQLGQPLILSTQTFVLHFSRKTADAETLAAIRAAMKRLEKRHAFRQVADRYLGGVEWDLRAAPAMGTR